MILKRVFILAFFLKIENLWEVKERNLKYVTKIKDVLAKMTILYDNRYCLTGNRKIRQHRVKRD